MLAEPQRADPFGATTRERVVRRLAGVGAAVVLVGGLAWLIASATLAASVAAIAYGVGLPTTFIAEWRRPLRADRSAAGRYAILGIAIITVLAVAWWVPYDDYFPGAALITLLFAAPVAAITGAVVGAVGRHAPRSLLPVLAVAGLLVGATAGVVAYREARPPAPHDFMLMHATPEVRAEFGDAEGLAEALAARFEKRAARGQSRLEHATWTKVADDITSLDLGNAQTHTSFRTYTLATPSGEPVRTISVGVGADRACLVVTGDRTSVRRGVCGTNDVAEVAGA